MRRLAFIVAGLIGAAGWSFAANADGPEAEIRAVLQAQAAAWNRGDIDGYMDYYVRSDALEFRSGTTVTRGWKTVRDRYHRKYDSREKMGTLTFSDITVSSLNTTKALVQGRWSLRRKNDHPHGSFTLVFRHLPAGWRIASDHTEEAR